MKKSIHMALLTGVMVFASGCMIKPTELKSTFNAEQARQQMQDGKNTIKGSALLRQNGGGVVTCAGTKVTLVPATDYATERMTILYGNIDGGIYPYHYGRKVFANENKDYAFYIKQTTCDAQGSFKFQDIADGSYYVTTQILWKAGDSIQGGNLASRVSVKNGQTLEIVLTQ